MTEAPGETQIPLPLFEQLMALCTKIAAKCLQLWIKLETSYVCVAPPT